MKMVEMKIPKIVKGIVSKDDVIRAGKECRRFKRNLAKGIITDEMKKKGWGQKLLPAGGLGTPAEGKEREQ